MLWPVPAQILVDLQCLPWSSCQAVEHAGAADSCLGTTLQHACRVAGRSQHSSHLPTCDALSVQSSYVYVCMVLQLGFLQEALLASD
jgi:hypothetical protein